MGRKWTNVRFVLEDRKAPIREASANPRTQQQVLYDFLTERWDDDNVSPVENIDVMFGNPSTDKLTRWVDEVFQEFPFVLKAGAVHVTDSAYVGYGFVFERGENEEATLVEEYAGYEGAEGNDVAGMIQEDHRIRVDPTWQWD